MNIEIWLALINILKWVAIISAIGGWIIIILNFLLEDEKK